MPFFRSVDTLGSIQKKLQIHADAGAYKRYEQTFTSLPSPSRKRRYYFKYELNVC